MVLAKREEIYDDGSDDLKELELESKLTPLNNKIKITEKTYIKEIIDNANISIQPFISGNNKKLTIVTLTDKTTEEVLFQFKNSCGNYSTTNIINSSTYFNLLTEYQLKEIIYYILDKLIAVSIN